MSLQVLGVERAVDDLIHACFDLGIIAVADRLDQQVFERDVVEGLAEHIEDLAAERGAFDLDLVEQLLEHLAFAGAHGNDVPQVADLGLADAVDAPEALFESVGVPRQVIVDHEVGVLQVDAFAGGVGGDQDADLGVVAELFLDLAPLVAVGAAVDDAHRLRVAEQVLDAREQVIERVLVLGEEDQLAAAAAGGEHLRLVLQQAGEFFPLLVVAGVDQALGLVLEVFEDQDLGFQLGDGLGGGGLIDHLIGEAFVVFGAEFFIELVEVFGDSSSVFLMLYSRPRVSAGWIACAACPLS